MSRVALAFPSNFRVYALAALLAAFAWKVGDIFHGLRLQPEGVDFLPLWAGVKAALSAPDRLYDFTFVTGLQDWPMGPKYLRPFIYPPSALLVLAPFGALPAKAGYIAWVAATYLVFAFGARRVGAPWWIAVFPVAWLVAICGQLAFLIGGLTAVALTLRNRPILAGCLLGLAAAIKPQMLLFAPIALVARGAWASLLSAGATGLALCLAAAVIWGPGMWLDWLAALPRFHELVVTDPGLVRISTTPHALLLRLGVVDLWPWLVAALAVGLAGAVWIVFRRESAPADQLIVLFAGALLVAPYAMHYEACLLLPGVAAHLARIDDRRWPVFATLAVAFTSGLTTPVVPVAAALGMVVANNFHRPAPASGLRAAPQT